MKKLSPRTHLILSYLYQLRALSYQEIKEFIFDDITEEYLYKILKNLIKDEYIEKIGWYKEEAYYQLLQKGVRYLDSYGIIGVGNNVSTAIPLLLPANKIKLNSRNINHQLELNHFVLRRAKEKTFEYYDEKYISTIIKGARPDGVIVDDKLLFLEMDMNTEREKALNEKWQHYRNFLTSDSFYNIDKDILGLFILGGEIKDSSKRKSYLNEQILKMLPDMLSKRFNFIIGTEERLFSILNSNTKTAIAEAFKNKGYQLNKGEVSNGAFSNFAFDLYINKLSPEGSIQLKDGEVEEYVIDDLTDENLYSLHKIQAIATIESGFRYKYKRHIKYIAIVEDEDTAFRICKELGVFNDNIYFTTLSRLRSSSLYPALFQFNENGQGWSFSENSLKVKT